MTTTPTLNRNASTTPPAGPSPDRRRIWMVIVSIIAVVAVALTVGYATGLIGADDTTPDDPAVEPPAGDDVPADDPTAQPPATVRYDEEPRANWDVTGVTANDVLNVRDAPGVDAAIVATLAHDAAEFESTGRIAHVGDQLWREVIVPGDGVGWVSAAYLTETK